MDAHFIDMERVIITKIPSSYVIYRLVDGVPGGSELLIFWCGIDFIKRLFVVGRTSLTDGK